MKISCISRITLLIFILAQVLVVPVSAHPGKTDSNGGHTDHETGEYHYHHGYPAHDHYDIDGDGNIDCPYEFDDRTDHSSKEDKTTFADDATTQPSPTTKPTNSTNAQQNSENKEGSFFSEIISDDIEWVLTPHYLLAASISACVLALMFLAYRQVRHTNSRLLKIPLLTIAAFSSLILIPAALALLSIILYIALAVCSVGTVLALIWWILISIKNLITSIFVRRYHRKTIKQQCDIQVGVPSVSTNLVPSTTQTQPCPVQNHQENILGLTCHHFSKFLWQQVRQFRELTATESHYRTDTYLWTALFFVAIKHIRKQSVADSIFATFPRATREETQNVFDVPDDGPIFPKIRAEYVKVASILNAFDADPRTDEGLDLLWSLISMWISPQDTLSAEAKEHFISIAHAVADRANSMFQSVKSPEKQRSEMVKYSIDDAVEISPKLPD